MRRTAKGTKYLLTFRAALVNPMMTQPTNLVYGT